MYLLPSRFGLTVPEMKKREGEINDGMLVFGAGTWTSLPPKSLFNNNDGLANDARRKANYGSSGRHYETLTLDHFKLITARVIRLITPSFQPIYLESV